MVDGRVSADQHISILSHYLTGIAYDFYTQKVSLNKESWNLADFYSELVNYCFPINFRMQMRQKWDKSRQNEKSVSEWAHELEELFNMIGDVTERAKVLKLWTCARPSIQKELWHSNLNPEITSWTDLLAATEVVEIAEGVTDFKQPHENKKNNHSNSNNSNNAAKTNNWKGGFSRSPPANPITSSHPNGALKRHSSLRSGGNRSRLNRPSPASMAQSPALPPKPKPNSHGWELVTLSEKERAELAAENKCFNCREVGHISRNCLSRNSIRGKSKRPPGMTNFSIELAAKEEDSDELIEIHEEIPVSAIGLLTENWCRVYPQWEQDHIPARSQLGDCYTMAVEALLVREQPYPGDDNYSFLRRVLPYTRFKVTRVNRNGYYIKDLLTEFEISIPMYLLENSHFKVGGWYA